MGLDDRDYMRERRGAGKNGGTKWNEGKGRIEAAWHDFSAKGQHFNSAKNPYRNQPQFRGARFGWLAIGVMLLSYAVPAFLNARRCSGSQ